jgi:hypothetical protein
MFPYKYCVRDVLGNSKFEYDSFAVSRARADLAFTLRIRRLSTTKRTMSVARQGCILHRKHPGWGNEMVFIEIREVRT